MKQKITLVQKVATLEEFYQMLEEKELPLALEVTVQENENIKKGMINISLGKSKKENLSSLYFSHFLKASEKNKLYLRIDEVYLRELIESNNIYIPTFIDSNGNQKHVDYIHKSHSFDFGDSLVFRDKARIFSYFQGNYSLKKNRAKATPISFSMGGTTGVVTGFLNTCDKNSEELCVLCANTIYECQNKQLIKKIS